MPPYHRKNHGLPTISVAHNETHGLAPPHRSRLYSEIPSFQQHQQRRTPYPSYEHPLPPPPYLPQAGNVRPPPAFRPINAPAHHAQPQGPPPISRSVPRSVPTEPRETISDTSTRSDVSVTTPIPLFSFSSLTLHFPYKETNARDRGFLPSSAHTLQTTLFHPTHPHHQHHCNTLLGPRYQHSKPTCLFLSLLHSRNSMRRQRRCSQKPCQISLTQRTYNCIQIQTRTHTYTRSSSAFAQLKGNFWVLCTLLTYAVRR